MRRLAHIPEKWTPVFRKGYAPLRKLGACPDSKGAGRALGRCALPAALLALLALPVAARAQSVEEFYKGKAINLAIGFDAGGGYDIYGRLLSRHLSRHIPGHPAIVVQNMPGAGSQRAAQWLYSVAPKDGTALGTFGRQMGIAPLLTPTTAQFDGTKFNWIGSITNEVSTCITWHTSAVKTWSDMLSKQVTLGGDGPGADPDVFALLYKNVFDAKIKLVSGYHGTTPILLAMERGEVEGLCGYSWSTIKSKNQAWLNEKKINIIVQAALRKEADIAEVPLALDLAKTEEQRQILKVILTSQEIARPFAAPPDVPADRVAALRAAFDATMKDAEFLAEAKKLNLDVNPLDGKTITNLLVELYGTPKAVLEKAAQAVTK
jgi:tripartite-type tricarboxylate transporter receptor subunit TctC